MQRFARGNIRGTLQNVCLTGGNWGLQLSLDSWDWQFCQNHPHLPIWSCLRCHFGDTLKTQIREDTATGWPGKCAKLRVFEIIVSMSWQNDQSKVVLVEKSSISVTGLGLHRTQLPVSSRACLTVLRLTANLNGDEPRKQQTRFFRQDGGLWVAGVSVFGLETHELCKQVVLLLTRFDFYFVKFLLIPGVVGAMSPVPVFKWFEQMVVCWVLSVLSSENRMFCWWFSRFSPVLRKLLFCFASIASHGGVHCSHAVGFATSSCSAKYNEHPSVETFLSFIIVGNRPCCLASACHHGRDFTVILWIW